MGQRKFYFILIILEIIKYTEHRSEYCFIECIEFSLVLNSIHRTGHSYPI